MPKPPVDSQIRARVEQFTEELSELIRQAALEAVGAVLGEVRGTSTPRKPKRAGRKRSTKKKAAPRDSARRVRRSTEDLEQLGTAVLAHVKSNPGHRLEQIAAAIRENSGDLKRPIQILLADKKLRTEGQRRGTKYFAGGRGGGRKRKGRRR